MGPKELAERIIRILDDAASREAPDLPDALERQDADLIRDLYNAYKRKSDFTTASFRARAEVVEKIILDWEQSSRSRVFECIGCGAKTVVPARHYQQKYCNRRCAWRHLKRAERAKRAASEIDAR